MASIALTSSSTVYSTTSFLTKSPPSINSRSLKSHPSIPHLTLKSNAPRFSLNPRRINPHFLSSKPSIPTTAVAAASASSTATAAPDAGARLIPLLTTLLAGAAVWFAPRPSGISPAAWHLLAIFLATIVGLITQPLPFGAVALTALGAAVLTKTLPFSAAFSAFGDPIPWLIALAFFFARAFIKTGLGTRAAYHLVRLAGGSALGLGYSLVISEFLLAPAIPSVSARAGGVMMPIIKALCAACGSNAGDGTERRLGSWLVLTCFHTSVNSCAMFLTASAANPLSSKLAMAAIGRGFGWVEWAKAAFVPGVVAMAVVPAVLYWVYPPEVKRSPDAPKLAAERLEEMGPMSRDEITMLFSLVLTVRGFNFRL